MHLQFLVFIIGSTLTFAEAKGALQMSYQNFQHSEVTCAMPNAAGSPKQPLVNLFSTRTHKKKKREEEEETEEAFLFLSWQKVEADTFSRASWQRKPLFVSPPFCYPFEDESVLFPLPPASVLFFAFLISKWAERQLGQNCFRDGGRGGGERRRTEMEMEMERGER